MKKILLLLILGAVCCASTLHAQESNTTIFKMRQHRIAVYQRTFVWDKNRPAELYTDLEVRWRVPSPFHKTYRAQSRVKTIFLARIPNNRNLTVDTLYQHCYDWISAVEIFAKDHNEDGTRVQIMKNFGSPVMSDYYELIACKTFTKVTCSSHEYYSHNLTLKNIIEFKKRLLKYIDAHNISIWL